MKAFLWNNISVVSDRYHPGGSVLIEAETVDRAREIAVFKIDYGEDYRLEKMSVEKEPDRIFESNSSEEKVWVFENAGCC